MYYNPSNLNNLGGIQMKLRSSLVVPVLAASILVPTIGSAVVNHKTATSNTSASTQQENHKGTHEKGERGEKGEKQKELTNIINQYASSQLKAQLTKDLATHENLKQQLRQTPGFQKKEAQEKAQRKAFYQAHKQEIDSIRQQVKDGKLTKQQAHKQLEALFEKQPGKDGDNDKGKEQGERSIHKELKAAVQKKDQAAINSALEKLDQQLKSSNQKLQQEIAANK
jgi:hypothetical protein